MPKPPPFKKHTEKVSSVQKDSPQTSPKSHCLQGTLEDRRNTGWSRFTPMAWPPWYSWQLYTEMNTITVTSQFQAACCSRAHTWLWEHAEEPWPWNSTCTEYFPGLRKDAMSSWKSFPVRHMYKISLAHEGWLLYSPGMSRQTCSGGAQLSILVMPAANGAVVHMCLFVEHSGHKSLTETCGVQKGISHTFQVVWGCWLMP